MSLIRKVNIRYFRSVYTATLNRCKDLNIISGQNDAGKSNILKALNLFFNSNTEWNKAFDFYKDLSIQRLQQVRKETVKGKQFVSIDVEFEHPTNYQQSLPPTFTVKRTWLRDSDRYRESNNIDNPTNRRLLPSTLETARRFLSQFLNRIHFEYVPAVKDRLYFSHLLSTLQARLLDSSLDTATTPVVDDLAEHIQSQIGQLQSDFKRATKLDMLIEPPQELAYLFQSFQVSTNLSEGTIPLLVRGDGIQALYVPSVLNYIASRSHDFFVWGFEEPENSLEYSHISSLAHDFEHIYSKNAQIFIASHSPAFVSFRDTSTVCYRAFKVEDVTENSQVWPEKGTKEHGEFLMRELGVLQIQKEIHEQYAEKLSQHNELMTRYNQLQNEIREQSKPLLLVEGKYDKAIIESVWKILFFDSDIPFIIRVADPAANKPGGGAAGAESVKTMVEALHPDECRKAIGLFDRDDEGLKCFNKLSNNFHLDQSNRDVKRHRNGLAYALLLPTPDFREDYATAKNLTIECMFPDDVVHRQTEDGHGLKFSQPTITVRAGNKVVDLDQQEIDNLLTNRPGYDFIESGKDVFSEHIVPNCTQAECESFRPFFTILSELMGIQIPNGEIS